MFVDLFVNLVHVFVRSAEAKVLKPWDPNLFCDRILCVLVYFFGQNFLHCRIIGLQSIEFCHFDSFARKRIHRRLETFANARKFTPHFRKLVLVTNLFLTNLVDRGLIALSQASHIRKHTVAVVGQHLAEQLARDFFPTMLNKKFFYHRKSYVFIASEHCSVEKTWFDFL